jgi:P27 family predicted phage terminase small subunit
MPTQLRLLSGKDPVKARRKLENEPKPNGSLTCPRWLSPAARAEWRRLAPELERVGLLTTADRGIFVTYCEAYALFRDASKTIAEEGSTLRAINGYTQQHPAVAIQRMAAKQIREAGIELGLSPSARGRLEVPDDLDNPVERLRAEAQFRNREL